MSLHSTVLHSVSCYSTMSCSAQLWCEPDECFAHVPEDFSQKTPTRLWYFTHSHALTWTVFGGLCAPTCALTVMYTMLISNIRISDKDVNIINTLFPSSQTSLFRELVTVSSCLCCVHRWDWFRWGRIACSSSRWVRRTHHSPSLDSDTSCYDAGAPPRPVPLQMLTSSATVALYRVSDDDTNWVILEYISTATQIKTARAKRRSRMKWRLLFNSSCSNVGGWVVPDWSVGRDWVRGVRVGSAQVKWQLHSRYNIY